MSQTDTIALISFLIGLGTTLAGIVAWYTSTVKKKYAAEREFGHIRRNLEQQQAGLNDLVQEVDRRFDSLDKQMLEIKAYMIRNTGA